MTEINNCQECQKSLIVSQVVNESAEYKYYSLSKENDEKKVCLDCWNKNQEQYKQDWENIVKREEHWRTGGVCNHYFDHIQAKCTMKNCGKKFNCETAEKNRHEWSQNRELSADDHEELNKNPAPVKTMEDLIKQWMKSMGYQKVFIEEGTMKIKKQDGKIREKWTVSWPGSWNDKLEKWLEEQPNKQIEVKAEREREREREQNQRTTRTNYWVGGYN